MAAHTNRVDELFLLVREVRVHRGGGLRPRRLSGHGLPAKGPQVGGACHLPDVLELAIIENIQRADLNSIEEAAGYRQLMDRFGHTQEKLSEALGKSRSHIANLLRLLTLPERVIEHVRNGDLSAGHARALVTADDPEGLAAQIIRQGLSVRQAEALAKKKAVAPASQNNDAPIKDADTRALEKDLAAALGMSVAISHVPGSESGAMTLKYKDLDQLDELCRRLSVTANAGKV